MAIQVNGTTVIDNNRNLVNIASGAGITTTTTTLQDSHSYTGANVYGNVPGVLGSSQPSSNYAFSSRTMASNTKLMSAKLTTTSSITDHKPSGNYYGATLGIALWNGTNLTLLSVLYPETTGVSSTSYDHITVHNKETSVAVRAVNAGDIVYGLVISSYAAAPSFTGGLTWSSGAVTLEVLEAA